MVALDALDLDLVLVFAAVVATAFLARRAHLPITALEIVAGIVLAAALRFALPAGTESIVVLGGLFIVFLAGFETGFGFLKANLAKALTVGLPGFVGPMVGLFAILRYVVHAPEMVSLIGATVLADTSISITYTTLRQYDLADLPFGRLLLASTLCVNLAEDTTVTAATVASTPGFLLTAGVLGALAVAAVLLPRLSKSVVEAGEQEFSNIGTRALLLSLSVLALLSALVGVPGILFVFLMGLVLSRYLPASRWQGYLDLVRPTAFALFIPLYFVAVGLKVNAGFVLAHAPLLLLLVGAAALLKTASVFPLARRVFGAARAGPVTTVMNTRLTSATVILTLVLGLGLLDSGWYSLFVSAVVVLALTFSAALRTLPGFRSPEAARALFTSAAPTSPGDSPRRPLPLPVRAELGER